MLKNRVIFLLVLGFAGLILEAGLLPASEVVSHNGRRRDPFVPLQGEDVSTSSSSAGFKLEGIIYDPGERSMAILNGKAYQVGDTVGDATVVKILKDYVVISVEGDERTLEIRGEEKAQGL